MLDAGLFQTNEQKITHKSVKQKSIKEDKRKAKNLPITKQDFVLVIFNVKATMLVCIDTNRLWMQAIQKPKRKSFQEKKEQNLKEERNNGEERKQNYG